MAAHSRAGLGHLHEREDALLHAGPAGDGEAHHRQTVLGGVLKQPGDLLAHHGAHAADHEIGVHEKQGAGLALHLGGAAHHTLLFPGGQLGVAQFLVVAGKVQNVPAHQVPVHLLKAVLVRQVHNPVPGPHAKMVPAGGAHLEVVLQIV